MSRIPSFKSFICAGLLLFFSASSLADSQEQTNPEALITINPSVTYQTITGWEGVCQAGQFFPYFTKIKEELFDKIVDLGINRLRMEAHGGLERLEPLSMSEPKTWFRIENDNRDSSRIRPEGFQFQLLDQQIEDIVLPLKKRLEARGETLVLNLTYVNFGKTFFHRDHSKEYAEFMLAIFLHLKEKYGFVPDLIEVILEPDHKFAGWNADHIADAIKSTSKVLALHGFRPGFVAPSVMNMDNAVAMFDELMRDSDVRKVLVEFSYHRYITSDKALIQIGERARKYGIQTAMLEHIGSSYKDLHDDLKTGYCSSWEQYTLAFPAKKDNGGAYFRIDDTDPDNPGIVMGKRTPFLRQYFRYIRKDAVRIDATSSDPIFDPLAFVNKNGNQVVVIKSTGKGNVRIEGLSPGAYGVSYGPDTPEDQLELTEQPFLVRIPQHSVVTIYRK